MKDELAIAAKWKEDEENPPISARNAIQLADLHMKELITHSDDINWDCKFAALMIEDDGCFWQIRYEGRHKAGNLAFGRHHLDIYVTMDGIVCETEVQDVK